jgi:hypothetical protein
MPMLDAYIPEGALLPSAVLGLRLGSTRDDRVALGWGAA